jgi:beta-galactosidase
MTKLDLVAKSHCSCMAIVTTFTIGRVNHCFVGLLALILTVCPASAMSRQRISLDEGWRFQMGDTASSPGDSSRVLDGWRWTPSADGVASAPKFAAPGTDLSAPVWNDIPKSGDLFVGRVGFAWVRMTLPNLPEKERAIRFASVDDNADVYLNGVKLAHHEGWNEPFTVGLDKAWKQGGPNELAVLIENTASRGGIGGVSAVHLVTGLAPVAARDYDDRSWRTVHLPHDYVVEGPINNATDAWHGGYSLWPAWYRKTFTVPRSEAGAAVWIDFDGIYRDGQIYLNGQEVGKAQSGYTTYRFDISKLVKYGAANVLAVRVNPVGREGWWYEGGGIYRHVWLNIASPVHVEPWGAFVKSDLPEPVSGLGPASANLAISTNIVNQAMSGKTVSVESVVFDATGKAVAKISSTQPCAPGTIAVNQSASLPKPTLWSLENPYLYTLQSTVSVDSKLVDQVKTPFGVRTIRFDKDKGFFLNGKPVKIKGFCNHQDFAGVGIAVPDNLEFWRVAKLKAMGANAWRMSHNPPTESLLDACDRLGMLVMDEVRHMGDATGEKSSLSTPYSDLSELKSMILRDRNHPSIVIWSMGNEETAIQGNSHGADIFKAMSALVRQYDTSRPISCAVNAGFLEPEGIGAVTPLMGINYSYGTYDKYRALHPDVPQYASETASVCTTRGEYLDSKSKNFCSNYDLPERTWIPVADRDFVAGSFIWTGFDYKGEPVPYHWPNVHSNFGVLDMCGFAKDSYYYYASWWKTEPIVHIMPHWNWPGKEGQAIRVVAFSNCETIELFVNGVSQGSKAMPRNGHVEWSVPYQTGAVEARGANGGKIVATDIVETTGSPAALRLMAENVVFTGNGEDVVPIELDVLDAKGRIVPDASNRIEFTITGPAEIAGTGNGDPTNHEADTGRIRSAFNGKAMVIIRAGSVAGPVTVTATSSGLAPTTLRLTQIAGQVTFTKD